MKRLQDLWRNSADELAEWCHTSTTKDFKTFLRRIKEEGDSFFTITLPAFGKDFDRSLAKGCVDSDAFLGFKRRRGLPIFLSGFLSQVFDLDTGVLLPDPSIDSIFAIRFLTNLFAKIELPCSISRVTRAMKGYVSCEQELEEWESTVIKNDSFRVQPYFKDFLVASRLLFEDVFEQIDRDIEMHRLVPKHGPGSTADGLLGNQKFRQFEWTTRMEEIFPYGEYCIPNWRYWNLLDHVEFLEPGSERPVKVIHVPKTLRSPRIIAMEPTCMQYMQQAILKALVRELEDPRKITSDLLGFSDQLPNRELAREGSLTGRLATLDLKEASDRVPYLLVQRMLERHHWLSAGVDATRSSRAEISELGLCLSNLRKFASMGSALCFPFEAMVFLAIVTVGIARWANMPVSLGLINELRGKVRIYGDDIIVPAGSVDFVIEALEVFGFKVNYDKSFWNGKFRESCGGDYYAGQDVTPVRLRKLFPSSRKDAVKVAALVEFRNHLYLRGLWKTTRWLDEMITDLLGNHFPIVEPTSPGLGRQSFLPYQAEKIADSTHSPMVKAYVLKPRIPRNAVEEEWALVKYFLNSEMIEDEMHLTRSGRPEVVDIKLRWVRPF